MKWFSFPTLILSLFGPAVVYADFVNPASLEITELSPSQFEIVYTLPLIKGRVLKAKPIFPDIFAINGDATERAVSGSVIRTWSMTCNSQHLVGVPIGVQGLLGTSQEILLTVQTLAGRSYRQTLRPTQSFYLIPRSPKIAQMAGRAGLQGMQQILRRFEVVLCVCVALVLGLRWRTLLGLALTFALSQMLGQGLSLQNWMKVSSFWAPMFCAMTTLLMVCTTLTEDRVPARRLGSCLWIPVFLLGMLYGAPQSGGLAGWVLSTKEQHLALVFGAIGTLIGLGLLIACGHQAKLVMRTWRGGQQRPWHFRLIYGLGMWAAALFWYEASTPVFVDGIVPVLPAIFWVTVCSLGLWCRVQAGGWPGGLALAAGVFFGLGLFFSFSQIGLPGLSLVMVVFLAFLGATLLFSLQGPGWLRLLMVALGTFYYGFAAGSYVRDATAMHIAHVVGIAILFSLLFFICYQVTQGSSVAAEGPVAARSSVPTEPRFFVRACGLLALALSVLWRVQEYRGWFQEQVLPELVMGSMHVPILTVILLLCAGLAWPRKRRFDVAPVGRAALTHWVLLGLAFYLFPHGVLRCGRPFYTPHAPTAAEAQHVMGRLLTNTYLAFNVAEENAAFDTLEENLSEDLIADVYLDSRRRLNAGTREGAQVTVKTVQVKSVDEVLSRSQTNTSFTYPCQWVVTARVKHLQHVHDRQNIYFGELTIGIEDNQWKITNLVLKSEERVIKPWQKA